jgi:hypothetical protein
MKLFDLYQPSYMKQPFKHPTAHWELRHVESWKTFWKYEKDLYANFSYPNDVILLLEEEKIQEVLFWHVIIGEKIGWIIVHEWMEVNPLYCVDQ